jgi:hypothetical protein
MQFLDALREDEPEVWIEETRRMSRDLRDAAQTLTPHEARFLVDSYYSVQRSRIRAHNQESALTKSGEPNHLMPWLTQRYRQLERQVQHALDAYSLSHLAGTWARAQVGIGPVLAAGLLAHIDITKAPTVGHIWSFAGLNPQIKWLGADGARQLVGQVYTEVDEEGPPDGEVDDYALSPEDLAELQAQLPDTDALEIGQRRLLAIARLTHRRFGNLLRMGKDADGRVTRSSMLQLLAKRPWNGQLKTLCWKASESFVKCSNHPDCLYGELYRVRKDIEIERNEAGLFAAQAAEMLQRKRIGVTTEAYKWYSQGALPPAHIQARSTRWAVKIFLSHMHEALFVSTYHTLPPKPYVLDRLGHTHEILPLHQEVIPGWAELRAAHRPPAGGEG